MLVVRENRFQSNWKNVKLHIFGTSNFTTVCFCKDEYFITRDEMNNLAFENLPDWNVPVDPLNTFKSKFPFWRTYNTEKLNNLYH